MKRIEIIEGLKGYFDIRELVCPHTFETFGERSWQFLDTAYLHNLLILRKDIFKVPMTCNNWHIKKDGFDERGLRCNICNIVKTKTIQWKIYLSAHTQGAAGDFDVEGLTAEDARRKIDAHQNILPYPMRLESKVTWLHVDSYDYTNGKIITYF